MQRGDLLSCLLKQKIFDLCCVLVYTMYVRSNDEEGWKDIDMKEMVGGAARENEGNGRRCSRIRFTQLRVEVGVSEHGPLPDLNEKLLEKLLQL